MVPGPGLELIPTVFVEWLLESSWKSTNLQIHCKWQEQYLSQGRCPRGFVFYNLQPRYDSP